MCHTGYGLSRQYTQAPSVHGRKQAAPASESPTQNPAKAPEVSDKNTQSSKINDTNSDEIIFSVINDFLI